MTQTASLPLTCLRYTSCTLLTRCLSVFAAPRYKMAQAKVLTTEQSAYFLEDLVAVSRTCHCGNHWPARCRPVDPSVLSFLSLVMSAYHWKCHLFLLFPAYRPSRTTRGLSTGLSSRKNLAVWSSCGILKFSRTCTSCWPSDARCSPCSLFWA